MHITPSPSTARRLSKRTVTLWLAAMALPLLGTGCSSMASARGDCYDARGRLEPSIVTKSECEARQWQWRERP
jgi:hypothetical protein